MKRFFQALFVFVIMFSYLASPLRAENSSEMKKQGAYFVKEGRVTRVTSRSLVINDKQYPISMFVRVFNDSEKGVEISMQAVANIGKIDKARIYLIGGKVEKIVVLLNI